MASLRCHGDSDCDKTQIIRNFLLFIIQLCQLFPHIFTHVDVVNAQTCAVSPLYFYISSDSFVLFGGNILHNPRINCLKSWVRL